ncbi:MAG: hypothetical protein ACWA41_13115 [Putridiphycobacter sp.]
MRWKFASWLSVIATNLSNILLKERPCPWTFEDLKLLPEDTVGYQLLFKLRQQNLSFKPKLIRHDLKHILLNYEMKMQGELEIHAFLLGNGSYNLMGIVYFIICTLILPETIRTSRLAFQRGKTYPCLKSIDILTYLDKDLSFAKSEILKQKKAVS